MIPIDSTFKEFESFEKLMSYLRAKGSEPTKGSNEKINLKTAFKQGKKNNMAVGIMNTLCHCGSFGDGGMIMLLSKESEDYKKHLKDELEPGTMMCGRCMDFLKILVMFNLGNDKTQRILTLLWHYKTGGNGWYKGTTVPEEWQEEVPKEKVE